MPRHGNSGLPCAQGVLRNMTRNRRPRRRWRPDTEPRAPGELTSSPELDSAAAAASRELERLEAERARQAASDAAGYVPRFAGNLAAMSMRYAMAANWKRGGTFVHCTYCGRRARSLRWFRRHWVREHCR